MAPRTGLSGYRWAYEREPGSGTGIDEETATSAEWARFRRDQARFMAAMARDSMGRAYGALRRYRRDPRWSHLPGNPEAREHIIVVRVALVGVRTALTLAAAAKADQPPRTPAASAGSAP